jgi:hypothetical protein
MEAPRLAIGPRASAPRPGTVRKDAEANQTFIISIDGQPQRLTVGDLGPKDARAVRKLKLGYSLAGLMSLIAEETQVDLDVPCVLWWLARTKAGEKITYEQAEDEFPSYADVAERLTIEVEDDTGSEEDGSPEP